jgi:glycosyltransferase involved in cell wall biosynthesis
MSPKKSTISAIILTKNEQEQIAACIDSIAWADEIIVVDNGSTDDTLRIVKEKGARIISSSKNDFSSLRMLGAKTAVGTWLLYLDADERVTPALQKEIRSIVATYASGDPVGYFVRRQNYYLGKEWPVPDKMHRFMYRTALSGWQGVLHETAVLNGPVGVTREALIHHAHRTLSQMLEKTNVWSEAEARLRLSAHHPPVVAWRLLRVAFTGFWQTYVGQQGWRAGTIGIIESMYQGFSMFVTYAKLWELQQKKKSTV